MTDALDMIALEAAGGEAEADAAREAIENPPPPPPLIDPAQTWAQIPTMAGALLAIAMPELRAAYTPDACLTWGRAMAVLAEKHEWDAAATMARFGPEIAVGMASIPLVLPVVSAIRVRRAMAAREGAKAAPVESVVEGMPAPGGFSEPT